MIKIRSFERSDLSKYMKLAIINDIHLSGPNKPDKYPRVLGEHSDTALPKVLEQISTLKPDALIHLGDLIIANSGLDDPSAYNQMLGHFSNIDVPTVHLIGNHELRCFTPNEVEEFWSNANINQKSYGSKELCGHQLLWLGIEKNSSASPENIIPTDQLIWLENTLKASTKPTIIAAHHPLFPGSSDGNTYFYQNDLGMRPANFKDAFNIIQKYRHVMLVIAGHAHWLQVRTIKNTHYITLPSMSENTATPGNTSINPQVYSILEFANRQLNIQCFSKEYCFAHIELGI